MGACTHPIGPPMPRLPSLLSRIATAAIAGGAMAMAGDAPPPAPSSATASHIAAALIAERAREQALAGAIASQLDALARALSSGQVSLPDAALVMDIAMAGLFPPPHGQSASAPKV